MQTTRGEREHLQRKVRTDVAAFTLATPASIDSCNACISAIMDSAASDASCGAGASVEAGIGGLGGDNDLTGMSKVVAVGSLPSSMPLAHLKP